VTIRPLALSALLLLIPISACSKLGTPSAQNGASIQPQSAAVRASISKPQVPPAMKVDGSRTMQYIKEIVAMGPRKPGSPGHKKLEDYIHSHLKGDQVEDDAFNATTPAGQFGVRNIIAKYPGTQDGIIVIAGHYDTNYPLPDAYVGANDGGSSTAILLEFANQLRDRTRNGKKIEGYSVWLVWTDAEEAFKEWSASDSIYGARHLAEKWKADGTLAKVKAFLLADMIGDADLNIEDEANTAPGLHDMIAKAAQQLGYESHFFARNIGIEDDHLPFVRAGIPSADFIDMDYGYLDAYHHTPEDTLDKLSPRSLEIAGNVILEVVREIDEAGGVPQKQAPPKAVAQ
jgi:Zn-dependent M28 family amino/carboxypeptidase